MEKIRIAHLRFKIVRNVQMMWEGVKTRRWEVVRIAGRRIVAMEQELEGLLRKSNVF